MNLLGLFDKVPQINQWQEQLAQNSKRQLLTGLSGSAKTLAIVSTFKKMQKSILVVTPNLYYTNQLVEDLRNLTDAVFAFPVDEVLSAEMALSLIHI